MTIFRKCSFGTLLGKILYCFLKSSMFCSTFFPNNFKNIIFFSDQMLIKKSQLIILFSIHSRMPALQAVQHPLTLANFHLICQNCDVGCDFHSPHHKQQLLLYTIQAQNRVAYHKHRRVNHSEKRKLFWVSHIIFIKFIKK